MHEEHQNLPEPDSLMEAFQNTVDGVLAGCGVTMMCYDKIMNSWPFWFLSFVALFDFGWQMYGLSFLFNTPTHYCHADLMRLMFRIRAVLFLLMWSYHVMAMLNALLSLA